MRQAVQGVSCATVLTRMENDHHACKMSYLLYQPLGIAGLQVVH